MTVFSTWATKSFIYFVLKGEKGAIVLAALKMPADLPHLLTEDTVVVDGVRLMGADLGHHAYEPTYEGEQGEEECVHLDEQRCYYSSTSLGAMKMIQDWGKHGLNEQFLIDLLQERYDWTFDE